MTCRIPPTRTLGLRPRPICPIDVYDVIRLRREQRKAVCSCTRSALRYIHCLLIAATTPNECSLMDAQPASLTTNISVVVHSDTIISTFRILFLRHTVHAFKLDSSVARLEIFRCSCKTQNTLRRFVTVSSSGFVLACGLQLWQCCRCCCSETSVCLGVRCTKDVHTSANIFLHNN